MTTVTQHPLFSSLLDLRLHLESARQLKKEKHIEISGSGNSFSKGLLSTSLASEIGAKKILWVIPNNVQVSELVSTLNLLTSLPIYTAGCGKQSTFLQRDKIGYLDFMATGDNGIFITTIDFLASECPRVDTYAREQLSIRKGQEVPPFQLFQQLLDLGYEQSEDKVLHEGSYTNLGDTLRLLLPNSDLEYRITFFGDMIEQIETYNTKAKKVVEQKEEVCISPMEFSNRDGALLDYIPASQCFLIGDELETVGDEMDELVAELRKKSSTLRAVFFTAFPETDNFVHMRYLSLLKYYTQADFLNDIKERYIAGWATVIYTKDAEVMAKLFLEHDILYAREWKDFLQRRKSKKPVTLLLNATEGEAVPHSFQNVTEKIGVITDREIVLGKKERRISGSYGNSMMAFLASLKKEDFVVHADHGIGQFTGIDQKTIDDITREYLEIHYAANDKLFVPTDQADKISKYISNDEKPPKLTRLDSTEWTTINKKAKKEAEKIAKDLLELYAKRELAAGQVYKTDKDIEQSFADTFPYTETPGQIKAISDVLADMANTKPMDRLICGDVGFGKTEVAMRAAFRAFLNKKQVALISPITILADQHYKSFVKRMNEFGVRIEMLSRFKTPKEQKEILLSMKHGEVDIVIGTHRLLSKDIEFKDLGIIIVDEEQRFGVKQKERLKEFRADVDVLTLSANPIPRTLHMSLNNLRDITTITTPPPGRLPVITEVRKYSDALVIEGISQEIARNGQVYFLHNKVRTIEGVAFKLRKLLPKARVIVAHGQLDPRELEKRIFAFKNGDFDVLVSSTIVENGIDLPNANTLIVNNADSFGLSQLYQLRGRVGRGRTQAYSFLLYNSRKLKSDAKKRLRAIVEASELGSGFQIAMKDLEIRGAGDILGSSQHGVMNSVGVSHFIRMLNQQVEELKKGQVNTKKQEKSVVMSDVTVDVPLTAYIPDWYITEYEEKIRVYQTCSSLKTQESLRDYMKELEVEYGELPTEVKHIGTVIYMKIRARRANVSKIKVYNQPFGLQEVNLEMGPNMKPEHIFSLLAHNKKWIISEKMLKIPLKDIGIDWINGIKESLIALSKVPDKLG